MSFTVLLDVDDTIRMNKDGTFVLNQNLLNQLKTNGISKLNLFTNMNLSEITNVDPELNPDESCLTRGLIVKLLKEQGFNVESVITAADIGYKQGLGAAFKDLYMPAYDNFLKTNDPKLAQTNNQLWIQHGESIYDEEAKKLPREKKAAFQKSKMFLYLIEEQKKAGKPGPFLYFDDDQNCLDEVAKLAKEYGIAIVTQLVDKFNYNSLDEQQKYAQAISHALIESHLKVGTAVEFYKSYTQNIWFSLFHRHGETGIKRAERFLSELAQTDANEQTQKIIDYLSNSKNGNTHPHSFRTILLAKLLGVETNNENLKTLSNHYEIRLAEFKDKKNEQVIELPLKIVA